MSLPLFLLIIDVATIVCVALLGARVLLSSPRLRGAQLVALIAFNSVCHYVLGRYDYRYWIPEPYRFEVGSWEPLLGFVQNLTPGVFMFFCFELFSEERRFPRWLLALFALQLLVEGPVHWLLAPGWPFYYLVTQVVPATLETLFAFAALYWTLADWRGDLVETRRAIRALNVVAIGINIILSSFLLRVVVDQNTIANYYTHEALTAFSLIFVVVALFLYSNGDASEILDPAHICTPAPAAPKPADAETLRALSRLANLLEVEHVYRRPSLTLGELADLAGVPEYRLRKLIHEELGYLNFNAFLHDYRIQEACRQLRDPAMRRTPILTIALSVGYQSVNTFNRGFRDITDMTPSAYRALDDAPPPVAPKKIAPETA